MYLHIFCRMGGIPACNSKGEKLLVFIGITYPADLQAQALLHDGDTVYVQRPSFYTDRFQKFICTSVFKKHPIQMSPAMKGRGEILHGEPIAQAPQSEPNAAQLFGSSSGSVSLS